MAQKLGGVDGKRFMLAFLTGFEVECKISGWMLPQHYMRGMHSVGTVGAFAAAAKLMGLSGEKLRWGFGIAASLAAGIRCNFGTMTKPLHVGRACKTASPRHCSRPADTPPTRRRWTAHGVSSPCRAAGSARTRSAKVSAAPGRLSSLAYRSSPIPVGCSPIRPST